MDPRIQAAVDLIRSARSVVALTGAGISTPSGIPDFRSPASGLWEQANPFEVANIGAFRRRPQDFYNWIRPLAAMVLAAQPNPAHLALSRLEQMGRLSTIITQNIDDLHTRAGSKNVLEVHGHLREMTCVDCGRAVSTAPHIGPFLETGRIPRCPACSGVLKLNVVLFGEQLPPREFHAAQEAVAGCDVLLVAGSSLEVPPVADLPLEAARRNAAIIIVNLSETFYDRLARVIIRGDVAAVLPQIVDALEA